MAKAAKQKFVLIFTEGETDKIFYQRLISYLTDKHGDCKHRYAIHDIKGIGHYASKVPGIFENRYLSKYKNSDFTIFCTYDTDVFKFKAKPPVDWDLITKDLSNRGAVKVCFIKAETMIEDWFLLDKEGLCRYLRISVSGTLNGNDANEKMKNLFKKSNKVYQKGTNCSNFTEALDIEKIYNKLKIHFTELEDELFNGSVRK